MSPTVLAKRNVPFFSLLASFILVACTAAEEVGPTESDGRIFGCPESDPACTAGSSSGAGPASSSDGTKNGTETDVDCGGDGDAPRCEAGKHCNAGSDCASGVCTDGTCQPPRPDDGVKNGDETDVDCGGSDPETPRCAVGKECKEHSDCESDGCAYNGKCALARSCTGHHGGDTCGPGETGTPEAQHESCCASAPISEAPNAPLLDKYLITAGRMRQFVERMNGNLRAFGETLKDNPNWKPEWTAMLPASIEEVNYLLGPTGHGTARRGCDLGESRGRTYWMSPEENRALGEPGTHPFSKEILDEKVLNCVEFFMLQALCIWDGGRLATAQEIQTAWTAGGKRDYPWGNQWDANRVVHKYSYSFPYVYDQGNFVFVAAPGRRPGGNGKFGHADLAGLVIEMTSNTSGNKITWVYSGSWEGHEVKKRAETTDTDITRAYWAVGGRCARPR